MKAKDKALELVNKIQVELQKEEHIYVFHMSVESAKRSALIAVDEIMKAPHENSYLELIPSDADDTDWFWDKYDEYWNEVITEIEKL